MATASIRTEGLTKRFGGITAVDGLDLTVERGEVFGFLGPNGSGKTSTIRLLLGFLRPDAGRSEVLGGAGADPQIRRRIGYLPADPHLDPAHRGTDVFELFGRLRGSPDRTRLAGLIDRFDLDPDRPIGGSAPATAARWASPKPLPTLRTCCSSTSRPRVSIPFYRTSSTAL